MTRFFIGKQFVLPALLAMLVAVPLHAQQDDTEFPILYWQGGTGGLTDANYTNSDGTITGAAPTSSDVIYFGDGGEASLSTPGSVDLWRLRIGHNQATEAGQGTVTVSGGATLNLIGGQAQSLRSGLLVGYVQNGSLLIDGPGTTVTSARLIVIGFAPNQPNRNGTVRITNGGSLIASDGNINLGTSGSAANNGIQGHLIVEDGFVSTLGAGADLNIGQRNATSSFSLASGVVEISDVVEVATAESGVNNHSTFSISGGTFTNYGHFFVGRGASTNATVNITGGELNVGNRFLMGSGTATGVTTNHSGGTLNASTDIRVGDVGDVGVTDSTYNLSGTGVLNSTAGGIVGRQGTGRFIQTGGVANFTDTLALGNREVAANATTGLYKISAGELNAGAAAGTTALNIAPNGTGEFRVAGDGAIINLYGSLLSNNTDNGIGTLAFELEPSELLSTINVTDSAVFSLGSKLVFDATNASPTQTTYDLLKAASIDDQGLEFSGPSGWSYQIVTGDSGQILQAVGPTIADESADFDGDGDVDGRDFLIWQRGFGLTGSASPADGDANSDGNVNDADLAIWQTQYASVPTAAAVATVPEPATAVVSLIAAIVVTGLRQRQR
jgi:hypothetical protein